MFFNFDFLPSSVQFQLAGSVELSLPLILIITPAPAEIGYEGFI